MCYVWASVSLIVVDVRGPKMDAIHQVVREPNRLVVRMIVCTVLLGRSERIRSRYQLTGRSDDRVQRGGMTRFRPVLGKELAVNLHDNAMLAPLGRNFPAS